MSILDELIPDASIAEEYVGRKIHGGHEDLEILDWARLVGDNVLIKGPTGPGKRQPLSIPVLTPHGWTTNGDLSIDDEIIGRNGCPTKVIGLHPIEKALAYRITFNDGTSTLADGDHLWTVQSRKQRRTTGRYQILTTKEILDRGILEHGSDRATSYNWYLPLVDPIQHDKVELEIEPYLLGVLLANGSLTETSAVFTTNDEFIADRVRSETDVNETTHATSTAKRWLVYNKVPALKDLGLYGLKSREKFIPDHYLVAHEDARRDLLAGLMDCDGSSRENRRDRYSTFSVQLAEGVASLVRSLGGVAKVSTRDRSDGDIEYEVSLWMPETPFTLPRKAAHSPGEEWFRAIASIEPDGDREMRCITVDADDGLYVIEHHIVTHNTMLCRAYCAARGIPFVNINPGTAVEPSMLTGKEVLRSASSYWVDGILTAALRRGDVVILFDELNFWPPGVTGFLHSLTDDQRYIYLYDHLVEYEDEEGNKQAMPEIIKAAPDTLIVAAYNPRYEGTFRPNQAFENRFNVQFRWDYSEKVENTLISLPTLKAIAKELRRMHGTGEITVPISTNKLMHFQKMTDDLGLTAAIDNFMSYFDGSEHGAVENVMNLNRSRLKEEVRSETGVDPDKGRFVK